MSEKKNFSSSSNLNKVNLFDKLLKHFPSLTYRLSSHQAGFLFIRTYFTERIVTEVAVVPEQSFGTELYISYCKMFLQNTILQSFWLTFLTWLDPAPPSGSPLLCSHRSRWSQLLALARVLTCPYSEDIAGLCGCPCQPELGRVCIGLIRVVIVIRYQYEELTSLHNLLCVCQIATDVDPP